MFNDYAGATWFSHSSLSDFLKCPRAYYLKNVYKDPKTGHKIQISTPSLSLGQAVHNVIESLSVLPTEQRFNQPLIEKYNRYWKTVSGKRGGFFDLETEQHYKERGEAMLRRVTAHPGPLSHMAIKVKAENDLPRFWLSQEFKIVLCGKIDWLEYIPESDSVNIVDFKTGKKMEDSNSLQLPIYYLLVTHTQKRSVSGACYWYLESEDECTTKELPKEEDAFTQVLEIAKKAKLARQLNKLECPKNGCFACKPFEQILAGKADFVGTSDYNQDVYVLPQLSEEMESELL